MRARTEETLTRVVLVMVMSCVLAGCSFVEEAPSFVVFGAYFPAWMLCGLIGIVGAASIRMILTTPAVNDRVPFQLAVCTAAGVIAALLTWMALFR